MASWGCYLELLEKQESHIVLELKVPYEGNWKMSKFTALSQNLIIQVTPDFCAVLSVAPKAHPKLQAILINVWQYEPLWILGDTSTTP